MVEAFHDPPSAELLDECMLKVTAMHMRQRATWERAPKESRGPSPTRAVLWVVCATRPERAMKEWAVEPMQGWPAGFYANASERAPRVVVVSALPRVRETLLLRMMGTGEVLKAAIDDLRALPADAPERAMLDAVLTMLRNEMPRMIGVDYTTTEVAMRYQEAARLWEEEKSQLIAAGRAEGRVEGETLGRAVGLTPLVRQFSRKLGRPLMEAERARLLARLDTLGPDRLGDVVLDLEPVALAAWLADPQAR